MQGSDFMLQQALRQDKTYSVGLDASLTSFGIFCLPIHHDDWYGWTETSSPKEGSDMTRVFRMVHSIQEALKSLPFSPSIAVFEDYGPINKTSGKIAQRAEMCGMLKHFLLNRLHIPVVMVSPNSLKSFATGKGNAKKEEILNAAAQFGHFFDTSDEADAFFAARVGSLILRGERTGIDFVRINPSA